MIKVYNNSKEHIILLRIRRYTDRNDKNGRRPLSLDVEVVGIKKKMENVAVEDGG